MENLECSRCGGEGSEGYEEEPGRWVTDTCYHCSGTGKIDDETALHDAFGALVARMARFRVEALRKAKNEDMEGEGWAFCAAENMMSEWDYTTERVWAEESRLHQELEGLSELTKRLMVECLKGQS